MTTPPVQSQAVDADLAAARHHARELCDQLHHLQQDPPADAYTAVLEQRHIRNQLRSVLAAITLTDPNLTAEQRANLITRLTSKETP
ncbi:MAG: hypothetical protein J2O48_02575 [Solirubrobacterales bacterium]|nr:hypothetical protein [Solirubrobacterales bacterium]